MFSKIFFVTIILVSNVWASYQSAEKNFGSGNVSLSGSRRLILELVKEGLYFSALPWMKEYIVKNDRPLDSEMENALDEMLYHTGVRTFESLPESVLRKGRSGNIRYILAKRFLKKGKHSEALEELRGISGAHPVYPFVANLKGVIYSEMNKYSEATSQFHDCVRASDSKASQLKSGIAFNQLKMNKEYCLAGISRASFGSRDFKGAESNYLDISKDSFVWPEILFEEAWTSYYMKNYNRTLGKLISYKAPVFDFIFNPEIEVLKALTYLKMCLYDDANKTADEFYEKLLKPSRDLRYFLINRGKNYGYFYSLMTDFESKKMSPLSIVDQILLSIRKDSAFIEMRNALIRALEEKEKMSSLPRGRFNIELARNLNVVIEEYRNLIGSYIRAGLVSKYAELYSAFQGMSYIKLEVLAQRKEKLYQSEYSPSNKRGDVKYIERNDKQYFWTFNGEFWADELGDYVFALRSEC